MGKQSLMSKQVVESNPGTGLPVGFTGGPVQVAAPLVQRTPFVIFVSTKGQTFAKVAQQIPDIQDGDPVLCRGDSYTRLNPFKFYIISAFQHFSKVNGQGEIFETILDAEQAREEKGQWSEHIETLLVVILPSGELVPATCTFKTTKTNAAHTAIDNLKKAEDAAEWSKLSAEHKASAAVPAAYARFVVTVTLKRGTAKKSGFPFVAANAFVRPTGLADWDSFATFLKDPEKKRLCEAVYNRFTDRCEDIKAGV